MDISYTNLQNFMLITLIFCSAVFANVSYDLKDLYPSRSNIKMQNRENSQRSSKKISIKPEANRTLSTIAHIKELTTEINLLESENNKDDVNITTKDGKRVIFEENRQQVFKVQRNPDGKLSIVYGDREFSPTERQQVLSKPTSINRDIIFPDDDKLFKNQFKGKPRCLTSGKFFCTEVENYPSNIVNDILKKDTEKYEELFGEDIVMPSFNVTQRIDFPGEESLCTSVEKLVHPKAGLTKDNDWSFIVNQQNFTQGVRIEECVSAGGSCAMADSFPNGYTTECRQSYIYRQLLSISPHGNIVKNLFQFPSCCKCILKPSRFKR